MKQLNELQKVVASVAQEILGLMKKEKKKQAISGGQCYAPKGVILYFEGVSFTIKQPCILF